MRDCLAIFYQVALTTSVRSAGLLSQLCLLAHFRETTNHEGKEPAEKRAIKTFQTCSSVTVFAFSRSCTHFSGIFFVNTTIEPVAKRSAQRCFVLPAFLMFDLDLSMKLEHPMRSPYRFQDIDIPPGVVRRMEKQRNILFGCPNWL